MLPRIDLPLASLLLLLAAACSPRTPDTATAPHADVVVGIYRFSEDNNTLTIKAAETVNGPRPTNFEIEETFDLLDMVRQQ